MGQSDSKYQDLELSEIQSLYKTFIMECPSGSLHLHEFKKMFGVKSVNNAASLYLENIFRSFDENGDNTLDFIEFVAALHLVLRGKLEDKLRWSFKVFDDDGNGRLDRDEIARIIRGIQVEGDFVFSAEHKRRFLAVAVWFDVHPLPLNDHQTATAKAKNMRLCSAEKTVTFDLDALGIIYKIKLGNITDESGNFLNLEEVCDRVIERIDENNDGNISLEEFVEGACRDAWVKEFLNMEINPSNWEQNLQHVNRVEQIREA